MATKKILLVDDNKGQRITLESILKRSGFDVVSADCGQNALAAADKDEFAAALLDIKMPDITGIEVLRYLKQKKSDISVIMMTGYSETEYAIDALNAGAAAYLLKPANIEQVKCLLKQAIEYHRIVEENKAMSVALHEWNNHLEEKVKERTRQLAESYRITRTFYEELKKNFESTLEVLSIAIDQRDHLTSSHSFRVTQYSIEIGRVMGLPPEAIEKLRYSGLMHDLGKIEIREAVLCKKGSLTAEEYREIQTHALGTYNLLSRFKFRSNLADVPLIASSHHERFDGQGYPQGLKGEGIPLLARILAVADVLDAITSRRHYRTAMSVLDALSIIKRETGGHFDQSCTDALFKIKISEFLQIHMAENLDMLKPEDMIELKEVSLDDLYQACAADNPTADQLLVIQRVYHYYQGPVPVKLEGRINPAPRIESNEPTTNC